jgi:hypothetical protein
MQLCSSAQRDPLHIWVGKPDRAAAEKWVGEHLAQEQKYVDELLAVKGPRTIENCASSPASAAVTAKSANNGSAPEPKQIKHGSQVIADWILGYVPMLLNSAYGPALCSFRAWEASPSLIPGKR